MIRSVWRRAISAQRRSESLEDWFLRSLVLAGTCRRHLSQQVHKGGAVKGEVPVKHGCHHDHTITKNNFKSSYAASFVLDEAAHRARIKVPLNLAISSANAEKAWKAFFNIKKLRLLHLVTDNEIEMTLRIITFSKKSRLRYTWVFIILREYDRRKGDVPKWALDGLMSSILGSWKTVRESEFKLALVYFKTLQERNLANLTTYNIMLGLASKSGKSDLFIELFQNMESKGIEPNAITYTVLISKYRQEKNMSNVVYWYNEAGRAKIVPDSVFMNTVIKACIEADNLSMALDMYDHMLETAKSHRASRRNPHDKHPPRPILSTFHMICQVATGRRDMDMSMKILDHIHEHYPPNNRILANLDIKRPISKRRKLRWIYNPEVSQTIPMLSIHHMLLEAYTHAQDATSPEQLRKIYMSLIRYNLIPLPSTVVLLAEAFERSNASYEKIKQIVEDMDARRLDIASEFSRQQDLEFAHHSVDNSPPMIGKEDERVLNVYARVRSNYYPPQLCKSDEEITVDDFFDIADMA